MDLGCMLLVPAETTSFFLMKAAIVKFVIKEGGASHSLIMSCDKHA